MRNNTEWTCATAGETGEEQVVDTQSLMNPYLEQGTVILENHSIRPRFKKAFRGVPQIVLSTTSMDVDSGENLPMMLEVSLLQTTFMQTSS